MAFTAGDLTGVGTALTAVKDILGMVFPNKTEEEKAQMAMAFQMVQNQTDIDKTEAASNDPLQHWRGGLGWVCVMGYFYNFVAQPLIVDVMAIVGKPILLHPLAIEPLVTLTLGMLGLGGMHVYQQVKGAS